METRRCERCDVTFTVGKGKAEQRKRFCGRACSNAATAMQRSEAVRNGEHGHRPIICPCGATVLGSGKQRWNYTKKYCSTECRRKYMTPGNQKNPDNYVTFNCLNCGIEVTRYKKYGKGYNKYCSNVCAQKHTKTKNHVVLRDNDVLLDSAWEAAFWGIAHIAKLPIERFDRTRGVEWKPGQFYAPDFWLPSIQAFKDHTGIAVEIKGLEDQEDPVKWDAFRATGIDLVVMDPFRMEGLSAKTIYDTLRIACLYDN
jgi:hypothetical protein